MTEAERAAFVREWMQQVEMRQRIFGEEERQSIEAERFLAWADPSAWLPSDNYLKTS